MPNMIATKVLSWATDLDERTIDQARTSSLAPFIEGHIALMPDAHLGYGVTIGSVVPTRGAIIPSAVGVDIGCGMMAVQTSLTSHDLPDNLDDLLDSINRVVPAGMGQAHSDNDDLCFATNDGTATMLSDKQVSTAIKQMGTLGSGNHFIEVCLDESDMVWVVLHSGSRGIGNQLARIHIEKAKSHFEQYFIELPDPDLAYFVEDTPEFDEYMQDLNWAQAYAFENRKVMMEAVLTQLMYFLRVDQLKQTMRVNCHHNYTNLEHHRGKNIYVTRKGAISARQGEMGIIPGSMGTNSFIVKGLGNKASYNSAPHGAGRRMSRTQARKTFTEENFAEVMGDRAWLDNKAKKLLDEHPGSYKDIHQVIADSSELVTVVHELTQILNYKGA